MRLVTRRTFLSRGTDAVAPYFPFLRIAPAACQTPDAWKQGPDTKTSSWLLFGSSATSVRLHPRRRRTMPVPAGQYVRMSTEHQQYSLENQTAAIKRYAEEHDFVIVQKYEDVAKSGLLLRNRPGLRTMLHDVVSRQAKLTAILVLDVTRWGRFQDIDESAHYEFLCKQTGTPVHYCSETFSNDATLANMIIKTLKRSMAAEYSRELSAKVAAGHRRLASLGFRNGGIPGYGLRRFLVSPERTPKQFLVAGERKSLATDRVILVT